MPKSAGWGRDLYVAKSGDFTKVGRSQHVQKRMVELQRGMPFQECTLVALFPQAGSLELSIHRELEAASVQRYNEWFLARPADVIRCVAQQLANLER